MEPYGDTIIVSKDGLRGTVDTRGKNIEELGRDQVLVNVENGKQVWVPMDLLDRQPDGTYYLPLSIRDLEAQYGLFTEDVAGPMIVLPVVVEELDVQKRITTKGVRVTKKVESREERIDEPMVVEELEVERVPVNRHVEKPLKVRYEGDTMIIPVMEEQLVIEKRLLLREEIRVTKHRREVRNPQTITLRRSKAMVEPFEEEVVRPLDVDVEARTSTPSLVDDEEGTAL